MHHRASLARGPLILSSRHGQPLFSPDRTVRNVRRTEFAQIRAHLGHGREVHPDIDRHGRIVINFQISWFIYCVVSGVLCFVLVGIPLLFFFGLLGIILPIVGAVRAADGIIKPYFTSINFLSLNPRD